MNPIDRHADQPDATLDSVWAPQEVPAGTASDALGAAMIARSARNSGGRHEAPPHVVRERFAPEARDRPRAATVPAAAVAAPPLVAKPQPAPISARYAATTATKAPPPATPSPCPNNCCPVDDRKTLHECKAFNHDADQCDSVPGCQWVASSRENRSRGRQMTALAMFVLVLVLTVLGALVVRYSPVEPLFRLKEETSGAA